MKTDTGNGSRNLFASLSRVFLIEWRIYDLASKSQKMTKMKRISVFSQTFDQTTSEKSRTRNQWKLVTIDTFRHSAHSCCRHFSWQKWRFNRCFSISDKQPFSNLGKWHQNAFHFSNISWFAAKKAKRLRILFNTNFCNLASVIANSCFYLCNSETCTKVGIFSSSLEWNESLISNEVHCISEQKEPTFFPLLQT